MTSAFLRLALTSVAAGAVCAPAFAQDGAFDRNRYVAVTERPQPAFDPLPIQAGAMAITSSLGLGAEMNDNVYAQSVDPVDDYLFSITPSVQANTNWSRNQISAGFNADVRQYAEQDTENYETYRGFLRGRLDVTRDLYVMAQANGARQTEMRYAPAALSGAAEPVQFDTYGGVLSSQLRGGRTQLNAEVGLNSYDYKDVAAVPTVGVPNPPDIDQDFRDLDESWVQARASYAVSPDVAFFVQSRLTNLDFAAPSIPLAPERDATRVSGEVGTSFELQAPFRGDIAIGYFSEDKDSDALTDFDGLSANARLQWFVTQLTTVTGSLNRTAFDPGLVNAASAAQTTFGARVDHELMRNILVYGDAKFISTDFEDLNREDKQTDLGVGLAYKINRHARIEGGYTRRDVSYDGAGAGNRDVEQNIFSINLRLFP